MSKGDYLRSILHRDWETDLKGRAVCRFTTNRPVVDTIFCEHYCDESSIPGWYDETGEYVFNPGVGKTEGTLCFDYSTLQGEDDRGPFVFEDVDFDGKDEILIRRTSPLRNSVHYYEVYKPVGADSCVLFELIRLSTGFIAIIAVGMKFLRKRIRLRGIILIIKCRYSGSIDESEYPDSIIRMPWIRSGQSFFIYE